MGSDADPGRSGKQYRGQKVPGIEAESLETWKMNLLAVSEKHRVLAIAVVGKLYVYPLDPFSG